MKGPKRVRDERDRLYHELEVLNSRMDTEKNGMSPIELQVLSRQINRLEAAVQSLNWVLYKEDRPLLLYSRRNR